MKQLTMTFFVLMGLVPATESFADPSTEQLVHGKAIYEHWCAPCHAASQHAPGTVALTFKYKREVPPVLVMRQDLDPDMIKYFARNGVSIMPSFRKTEISDPDLDALAEFIATNAKRSAP